MHYYLLALKKYAVFSGRSSRKAFWLFTLFNLVVLLVLGLPDIYPINLPEQALSLLSILHIIYALGFFIPSLAVSARRLHDTDRSAWNLLFLLLPLIGALILIFFYCIKGQTKTNKYGTPPKDGQ